MDRPCLKLIKAAAPCRMLITQLWHEYLNTCSSLQFILPTTWPWSPSLSDSILSAAEGHYRPEETTAALDCADGGKKKGSATEPPLQVRGPGRSAQLA